MTPWSAPLAALGRIRSEGVTDLRHGNVVEADWLDRDRFALAADRRMPTPLPDGVRCFAIAANSGEEAGSEALASDDLVPARSALGAHGLRSALRILYKQWEEGGVAPQIAFEILSPRNTASEWIRNSHSTRNMGPRSSIPTTPTPTRFAFGFAATGNSSQSRP